MCHPAHWPGAAEPNPYPSPNPDPNPNPNLNPNPNPNRNRNPDPNTNHSPDPNPDPSQVQPPISPYLEAVLAGRPLPATPPTTQLRVLMTYIAHALTRT